LPKVAIHLTATDDEKAEFERLAGVPAEGMTA